MPGLCCGSRGSWIGGACRGRRRTGAASACGGASCGATISASGGRGSSNCDRRRRTPYRRGSCSGFTAWCYEPSVGSNRSNAADCYWAIRMGCAHVGCQRSSGGQGIGPGDWRFGFRRIEPAPPRRPSCHRGKPRGAFGSGAGRPRDKPDGGGPAIPSRRCVWMGDRICGLHGDFSRGHGVRPASPACFCCGTYGVGCLGGFGLLVCASRCADRPTLSCVGRTSDRAGRIGCQSSGDRAG